MDDFVSVIVAGDPVRGFRYFGPFPSITAAEDRAERVMPRETWWVIPLAPLEVPRDQV